MSYFFPWIGEYWVSSDIFSSQITIETEPDITKFTITYQGDLGLYLLLFLSQQFILIVNETESTL